MRIHRLISIFVVLGLLALAATMSSIQQSPLGVVSDTVSAQIIDGSQSDGLSTIVANETTAQTDVDLYLDADEVEKRAAAEQAGDDSATKGPVPVSFKHVALPLAGGVDHAVAGVATRNSGTGVIRLRGVPPGSTLLSAVLVWGEITPPGPAAYNIGFGPDCATGAGFVGNVYGVTQQPCWNPNGVYAGYITNVTPQMLPGINGDYRVRGLRSKLTNHRCPWGDGNCAGPGNDLVLSEGASLIVFYSNACIPKAAQLYVSLGPRMFFGPHSVIHNTVPAINGNLPNLKHSRIGADGQVGVANCGLRSMPGISDERTWIENPVTLGSTQIKGDGAGLNRDSDWNGYDGEPLNKLWDSHTDVFGNGQFLAGGGGLNYRVRYLSQGDCIVWAAHILGVR
ncbi:MAG TPA: hypothetical protein VKB02_06985 [Pyrinomonadaceae bacterium]|nr:hypothetical protein [Pyrinomonadaceae bacterium]